MIVYRDFNVFYHFYRKDMPTAFSPLGGGFHAHTRKKRLRILVN